MWIMAAWAVVFLGVADVEEVRGEDEPAPGKAVTDDLDAARTIEQLTAAAQPSVCVITSTGRDGRRSGVGSGFVIREDGLIATNMHVIGEARPIQVELADGRRFEVTEVFASDRKADLAVIRVGATDLAPLPLGDSDSLRPGRPVLALGNPLGFEHSVTAGIVSATREIEGRPMIQLAMAIEPGNSGGPLLDLDGEVQGVINMKSRVTANLGFAIAINELKSLVEKPNPIPMDRWLTIGSLDEREWTTLMGARWRQRAGRILAEGYGSGFGGRTLCLNQHSIPELPYEVAVAVKLDDESGAAGLAFAADGKQKHYGFYASGGRLRFTRFGGPDINSWTIQHQIDSPHYLPGEWNTLKVRHEAERTYCYVNGALVLETEPVDQGFAGDSLGRVGLAKFRDTTAQFRGFRVAEQIPNVGPSLDQAARIESLLKGIVETDATESAAVDGLIAETPHSVQALRRRARHLDQQARTLRGLAERVHRSGVLRELEVLASADDIDLLRGALLIAKFDNEDLDVEAYVKEVENMTAAVHDGLGDDADAESRRAALDEYLFHEQGFHGSRSEYYSRANSYLNEVIDDREGLPITLSILYMEMAGRLDLDVVGIGLPGHFVVAWRSGDDRRQLLDVFDGAKPVSEDEARRRVADATNGAVREEYFAPVDDRAILVRMLQNLLGTAQQSGDLPSVVNYLDAILTINPDQARSRWLRAEMRARMGELDEALEDAEWLIAHEPAGVDMGRIRALADYLRANR